MSSGLDLAYVLLDVGLPSMEEWKGCIHVLPYSFFWRGGGGGVIVVLFHPAAYNVLKSMLIKKTAQILFQAIYYELLRVSSLLDLAFFFF